jgi:predicted GIY-YIG superfamily endonuclease
MRAIYGLIDPRDRLVFYVGQTTDVYKRLLEHINCSGNNFERNSRIHELRALNLMVIMEVFELVELQDDANEREAYWVRHFELIQHPLTNIMLMSAPKKAKRSQITRALSTSMRMVEHKMSLEDSVSAESETVPVYVPIPEPTPIVPKKTSTVDEAVAAWNRGNDSIRKLSRALDINFNQARDLINGLYLKGLIRKKAEREAEPTS